MNDFIFEPYYPYLHPSERQRCATVETSPDSQHERPPAVATNTTL